MLSLICGAFILSSLIVFVAVWGLIAKSQKRVKIEVWELTPYGSELHNKWGG